MSEHGSLKPNLAIRVDIVRLLIVTISSLNRSGAAIFSRIEAENEGKPKSLWKGFQKILHKSSDVILPDHTNRVDLTNMFGCFFQRNNFKTRFGINQHLPSESSDAVLLIKYPVFLYTSV